MKNNYLIIWILLIGTITATGIIGFVSASSGQEAFMNVSANLYGSLPPIIRIQVPDFIDLGDVPYMGNSTRIKVDINNTGDVNVSITPVLVNLNNEIFSNLYFMRRVSDGYTRIGEWTFNVSSSDSEYFYMRLDLTENGGVVKGDMFNQQAEIKFIATQLQV